LQIFPVKFCPLLVTVAHTFVLDEEWRKSAQHFDGQQLHYDVTSGRHEDDGLATSAARRQSRASRTVLKIGDDRCETAINIAISTSEKLKTI